MIKCDIKLKIFLISTCVIACVSCLPKQPNTNDTSSNNTRGSRRNSSTASGSVSRSDTQENTPQTGRKTRNSPAAVAPAPVDNDSLNIARLAAMAVNQKSSKSNSRRSSTEANPFDRRQELLKDVATESDRFIDTTYYMLKMENGTTDIVSDVATSGEKTQEFYENLIRAFNKANAESEQAVVYDCNVFSIYSNQFAFNDSLMQEAQFSFAECCASNDKLEEAAITLEALCQTKMNRGVAPKALVRLGQVYCILGDNSKARRYFNRLKKEFPRSVYNQLADCGRL